MVELKASQEYQASTLFLLLKLVQSDSELFSQFVNQDCHKLLLKVMQSPRCIAGHHMLKVGNHFLHENVMLVPKIGSFLSQALHCIISKCPIIYCYVILKTEASLNKPGVVKCLSIVSEGSAQKKSD